MCVFAAQVKQPPDAIVYALAVNSHGRYPFPFKQPCFTKLIKRRIIFLQVSEKCHYIH